MKSEYLVKPMFAVLAIELESDSDGSDVEIDVSYQPSKPFSLPTRKLQKKETLPGVVSASSPLRSSGSPSPAFNRISKIIITLDYIFILFCGRSVFNLQIYHF